MNNVTDDQVKEHLAANIGRLLTRRGWSGLKLAQVSGESQPTISRLLHGEHVPKVGTLSRIAAALDTSIDYLLSVPEMDSERGGRKELARTA